METREFKELFKPINIGNVEIKNRIVMPPMVMCYANGNGEINQQVIAHFDARATGNVGLLLTEANVVHPSGKGFESQLWIDKDKYIPRYHLLTNNITARGSAVATQLYHGGIQSEVEQPIGPSNIGRKEFPPPTQPKKMDQGLIEEIEDSFANAALRAKKSGFDMVEVHGTHGYLIAEFLSPLTNNREDKYGKDPALFALEIIKKIKKKCGKEYPIIFRLMSDEFQEGGVKFDAVKETAKRLEEAGVNAFNVTGGNYDTSDYIIPPAIYNNEGLYFKYASKIKEITDVPIISGGMIWEPRIANEAVKKGKVDMVFLGRQLIADPEWVNKVKHNQTMTIKPCIACNECVNQIFFQKPVICSVNPLKGYEYKYLNERQVPKAQKVKKVLVIGAGIAGLEAARVAKMRGHEVILFEKESTVGGVLNLIRDIDHKKRIDELIRWYENAINIADNPVFPIRFNTEVTKETIKVNEPQVVVIATGSKPLILNIEGIEKAIIADDVFSGKRKIDGEAVIIGGGSTGCELALELEKNDVQVTILECLEQVAIEEPLITQMGFIKELKKSGIDIKTRTEVIAITQEGVKVKNADGEKSLINCSNIILAAGRESKIQKELIEASKDIAQDVYVIGDAKQPRKILHAIKEGFWYGLQI